MELIKSTPSPTPMIYIYTTSTLHNIDNNINHINNNINNHHNKKNYKILISDDDDDSNTNHHCTMYTYCKDTSVSM